VIRKPFHKVVSACVVAMLLAGALYGWSTYRNTAEEMACSGRLSRNLYERILHRDLTLATVDDARLDAAQDPYLQCSCSHRSYEYHPFPGKINQEGTHVRDKVLFRMIAWCPSPCHEGSRVILLENGAVHVLTEEAFQEACRNGYLCENRPVRRK